MLAVDWGEKRFGLAISDPLRMIAQPLTTLTRRAGKRGKRIGNAGGER